MYSVQNCQQMNKIKESVVNYTISNMDITGEKV